MRKIKNPGNFKLYYSIYHPLLLLTSRQCLFHQVTGCERSRITEKCIQECRQSSPIVNLKKDTFLINKTEGNYHCIYNNVNYLNVDVVTEMAGVYSGFFIDLRDIETATKIEVDKVKLIELFGSYLKGYTRSGDEIKQAIHPTTFAQYAKGI